MYGKNKKLEYIEKHHLVTEVYVYICISKSLVKN